MKENQVTKYLRKIWQNSDTIFAERKVPAHVPVKLSVDWSKVNRRFLTNIPTPQRVPVLGCSPDPAFYTDTKETLEPGTRYEKQVHISCPFIKEQFPFGYDHGFYTNMGIIAATNVIVHGHTWEPDTGWVLHAVEQPGVQDTNVKRTGRDGGHRRGQRRQK